MKAKNDTLINIKILLVNRYISSTVARNTHNTNRMLNIISMKRISLRLFVAAYDCGSSSRARTMTDLVIVEVDQVLVTYFIKDSKPPIIIVERPLPSALSSCFLF